MSTVGQWVVRILAACVFVRILTGLVSNASSQDWGGVAFGMLILAAMTWLVAPSVLSILACLKSRVTN